MLKLNEQYAIGADDYSVIVLKKVYHKNKDGANGEPYWKNDGYFLKVSQALKHVLNEHIKETILSKETLSIQELLCRIENIEDELNKIKNNPIKTVYTKNVSVKTTEITDIEH